MQGFIARMSSTSTPRRRRLPGQQVCEEDVGAFDELGQDLAAVGGGAIQADAAFAPVRLLHERLERLVADARVSDDEVSLRVRSLAVLDLDHVGAPFGEDGSSGGTNRYEASSTTRTPSRTFIDDSETQAKEEFRTTAGSQ
jgi:hypothetical protein